MTSTVERPSPREPREPRGSAPSLPAPPVPWRGRDLAAVAGLGVAGLIVTIIVGFAVGWNFQEFSSPQAALMLVLNGTVPALFAYAYLWLRFRPDHRFVWRPGGSAAPRLGPVLGIGLAIGFGWWVAVDALAMSLLASATGYEPPPVQQELADALAAPGLVQVAAWVAIVIVAPLGEELVFRGIIFLGLARWLGGLPAAVISSLLFGLIHLQPDLAGTAFMTAYAAPFGLFACWLLHRYGTLWLPIGVHAGSNLASIGVATIFQQL